MYKNIDGVIFVCLLVLCFNPCFIGSMYKNFMLFAIFYFILLVSILVLLDLCIKTLRRQRRNKCQTRFNPCFIGSMYKNFSCALSSALSASVSILVLLDLCIKTERIVKKSFNFFSFNPCFIGSMYKNFLLLPTYLWSFLFQSLFYWIYV